jgi:hypothetical protein
MCDEDMKAIKSASPDSVDSRLGAIECGEVCETRIRAAHHEAGHVVAALHFGIPVRHAKIEDAPDDNGRWCGFMKTDNVVNDAETFERVAAYLWAGPIAERTHLTSESLTLPRVPELVDSFGGVADIAEIERRASGLKMVAWSGP